MKGNTDGSSKRNLGPSSIVFYIRNVEGDLVVTKGSWIQETSNLIVETIAIMECIEYCKNYDIS